MVTCKLKIKIYHVSHVSQCISNGKGYARTLTNHANSISCMSHGITGKNKENGIADTALKEEEF